MVQERYIAERLSRGEVVLPPLSVRLAQRTPRNQRQESVDACVDIVWNNQIFPFAVEYRSSSTPKSVRYAADRIADLAPNYDSFPLVIVPWLSPEQLGDLERRQISGIDLCGNGIVVVPGKLLVLRTGRPNAFPESRPIRNVYRGDSAVIARVFLLKPRFDSVNEVWNEVRARGGNVVLPTVSKVLRQLEEDLVIARSGKSTRLLQPDKLMANLAKSYRPVPTVSRFVGRCQLDEAEVLRRMARVTSQTETRITLTGASSANRYAAMAREPVLSFYCDRAPADLLEAADIRAEETTRFANLELLQTNETSVYFDRRLEPAGPFASPVQTWLELTSGGDKRLREVATQVEQLILRGLGDISAEVGDGR